MILEFLTDCCDILFDARVCLRIGERERTPSFVEVVLVVNDILLLYCSPVQYGMHYFVLFFKIMLNS